MYEFLLISSFDNSNKLKWKHVFLISDGAVYNIDPTSVKIRRRIALSNISHISTSQLSDNFFLIHVPTEYDYLYISGRKTEIVAVLRLAYMHATGEELNVALHNM